MDMPVLASHQENRAAVLPGWLMLSLLLVLLLVDISLIIYWTSRPYGESEFWWIFVPAFLALVVIVVLLNRLFTLQPNEARVLILFGAYKGTVRESGFHWGNPFYARSLKGGVIPLPVRLQKPPIHKISLRARTLNGEKLKVNDKRGNPIEIAAVIVWRVNDTAQAAFDVDDYEKYVQTQSETSLRHIASAYAYDDGEPDEITLAPRLTRSRRRCEENCRNGLRKRA